MNKHIHGTPVLAAAIAVALAAGAAGLAHAGSNEDRDDRARAMDLDAARTGGSTGLPLDEILARLRTAGYSDIREVERERGGYEVKGRDARGQRVELYLDPHTGEVMRMEHDD